MHYPGQLDYNFLGRGTSYRDMCWNVRIVALLTLSRKSVKILSDSQEALTALDPCSYNSKTI